MGHDCQLIPLKVRPRSSRSGVELDGEGVVVRVHAPAAEGAANREAVDALAGALGVPRSAVRIVRGERSRHKQVAVEGLSRAEALARLGGSARPSAAGGKRGG